MPVTAIDIISGLLIIIGTIGSVLPFLPGLPVAWAGLLIFTIWGRSYSASMYDIWGLIIFAVLILFTVIVDIFAPALAARGRKASKFGVLGGILGGLLGIFILGPIGILVGPFVGAFLGEIINSATTEHAFRVAAASLFGLVIGSAFKLLVGTSMFIYYIIKLV